MRRRCASYPSAAQRVSTVVDVAQQIVLPSSDQRASMMGSEEARFKAVLVAGKVSAGISRVEGSQTETSSDVTVNSVSCRG